MARWEALARVAKGDWWERIHAELSFAREMLAVDTNLDKAEWDAAAAVILTAYAEEGAVTKSAVLTAEAKMPKLALAAKAYKVYLIAHAHIDMNWMWGYHETASVTVETFRTMLKLMEEYPDFTFAQSQASVYRIVERHEPAMLDEIRRRVKEGRWEITASDWVEADKNMTSAESCIQHLIQTKTYLSGLFDLPMDSFDFCFEPDTFGHNANIPLVLAQGGIKYYYHCRGNGGSEVLYNWESKSGDKLLVFREPDWYNADANKMLAVRLPGQCAECGSPKVGLEVYGVGDHGGGPTRRDINTFIDMQSWPVYPVLQFGTFREFFRDVEGARDNYPTLSNELNFVFTGCYTSQSRIKFANRTSERTLVEAAALRAMANGFGEENVPSAQLDEAWRNTLFNHFHDILPGSGVIETREYAMGLFQEASAIINGTASTAMRQISNRIDTSVFLPEEDATCRDRSEGAGAGLGAKDYGMPRVERGRGKSRAYTVFNATAADKKELVLLTILDWPYDRNRLVVTDSTGNALRFEVSDINMEHGRDIWYWGHSYFDLVVEAEVPAMGYTTVLVTEDTTAAPSIHRPSDPRVNVQPQYVLENEYIRAEFATENFALVSLTDKLTGKELLRGAGGLMYALENCQNMSSWTTGRFARKALLGHETENVRLHTSGLQKWLRYDVKFENSWATVTVSLDDKSRMLAYSVVCDWREFGESGKTVPALRFELPLAGKAEKYLYDIPCGVVARDGIDDEVPGLRFGAAVIAASPAVMLAAKTKYGYRGYDDTLGLALIRSSYDPDPYPENYRHTIEFAVGVSPCACAETLLSMADGYNNALVYTSTNAHKGDLPASASLLSLCGEALLMDSAAPTRDGSGLVLRLYNTSDEVKAAKLTFTADVKAAFLADYMEAKVMDAAVSGKEVTVPVPAFGLVNVVVKL